MGMHAGVPAWAERYLLTTTLLHIVWCFVGMLWLASVHSSSVENHKDDLSRMAAQQESLHMKVHLLPILARTHMHCSAEPNAHGVSSLLI